MVAGMTASHAPTAQLRTQLRAVRDQISTVIRGKPAQIADAPHLPAGRRASADRRRAWRGQNDAGQALAITLGLRFQRNQFTADLLPSDLIGTTVYEREQQGFVFHPGPVFAQVLLADEINRAGPKTQSALLEAMEEHQVSVDGVSHRLPEPFFVIATQNPSEQLGTFPLPESQLDRFLMRISLGFLTPAPSMNCCWAPTAASSSPPRYPL